MLFLHFFSEYSFVMSTLKFQTGGRAKIHFSFQRYVQDMLKQEAFEICEKILSQKAHFYVCGDVSMAEDVCRTLQVI